MCLLWQLNRHYICVVEDTRPSAELTIIHTFEPTSDPMFLLRNPR